MRYLNPDGTLRNNLQVAPHRLSKFIADNQYHVWLQKTVSIAEQKLERSFYFSSNNELKWHSNNLIRLHNCVDYVF